MDDKVLALLVKNSQDVIDWLNTTATELEQHPDSKSLAAPTPYQDPYLCQKLEWARGILQRAISKKLTAGLLDTSRILDDSKSLNVFMNTIDGHAVVMAQMMELTEMPPTGTNNRVAWSLRMIAKGIWRAETNRRQKIIKKLLEDRERGAAKKKAKKRKTGRPAVSAQESRQRTRLISDFKHSKLPAKEFCTAKKVSRKHLTKCLNWSRMRKTRGAHKSIVKAKQFVH